MRLIKAKAAFSVFLPPAHDRPRRVSSPPGLPWVHGFWHSLSLPHCTLTSLFWATSVQGRGSRVPLGFWDEVILFSKVIFHQLLVFSFCYVCRTHRKLSPFGPVLWACWSLCCVTLGVWASPIALVEGRRAQPWQPLFLFSF
jgi:hypothetical protein